MKRLVIKNKVFEEKFQVLPYLKDNEVIIVISYKDISWDFALNIKQLIKLRNYLNDCLNELEKK